VDRPRGAGHLALGRRGHQGPGRVGCLDVVRQSREPVPSGRNSRVETPFDTDAIVARCARDVPANDVRREINGIDAIPRWVEKETETIDRACYDGTYHKTNLQDQLVISTYFSVRDGESVLPSTQCVPHGFLKRCP
jgi:hypothetical protein